MAGMCEEVPVDCPVLSKVSVARPKKRDGLIFFVVVEKAVGAGASTPSRREEQAAPSQKDQGSPHDQPWAASDGAEERYHKERGDPGWFVNK